MERFGKPTLKLDKGRPVANIFEFEKPKYRKYIGLKIVKPKGGGRNKKSPISIKTETGITTKDQPQQINKSIEIDTDTDYYLSPAIDPTLPERNQRNVYFIAGPSGSGKSTLSAEIMKDYKRVFPKNSIILFTKIEDRDPAFDGIDDIMVVILNEEFSEIQKTVGKDDQDPDALVLSDFKDSLVVFDDVDRITNKDIKKATINLRNEIFEMGRHNNTFMICTSHQIMNYQETKIALMESTHVVLFPGTGSDKQIEGYLKTYAGAKKEEIEKIMNLPSRWVLFSKHAPQYILYQFGIYLR